MKGLVTEIITLRDELSRLRSRLEDREGLAAVITTAYEEWWYSEAGTDPATPKCSEALADRIREYLLTGEK